MCAALTYETTLRYAQSKVPWLLEYTVAAASTELTAAPRRVVAELIEGLYQYIYK